MSNKTTKKIFVLSIILVLIIVVFLIFKDRTDKKSESDLNFEENSQKEIITYSRINFFLSSSNKASMSIPNYWEGNYRIKEEGNEVVFYYLDKKRNAIELFKIFYTQKDIDFSEGGVELVAENDDYIFYLLRSDYLNLEEDLYYRMIDDINDTIKSFKIS